MGSVVGKAMDENMKKQQEFMLETQRLQVNLENNCGYKLCFVLRNFYDRFNLLFGESVLQCHYKLSIE